MSEPWNHNIHYHPLVLSSVPANCQRALDIGCGRGDLTRKLALRCATTTGVDLDVDALRRAIQGSVPGVNLDFIAADIMTHSFPEASFDFITAVATLHHLPLLPALLRFRALLKPGGVLAIIGLYRPNDLSDYLFAAAGLPASWIMKRTRNYVELQAPIKEPGDTLTQIRTAAGNCLPDARLKRHLLFRYSLLWRKPKE